MWKAKEKGKRFCEECRVKGLKESKKESNIRFRSSLEGRVWNEEYQQRPKTKKIHADAQREYLATPYGRARSNWLHYNRYQRLHNKQELTFEQYSAKFSLMISFKSV